MGLARQDQESRLEDILGILHMPQYALTNGQNHAAMAAQQGRKSDLIVLVDKALQ
jgi:hypothetical protein